MANGGYHLYADDSYSFSSLLISDCSFNGGGSLPLSGTVGCVVDITNTLFDRVNFHCFAPASTIVRNCHFEGGSLLVSRLDAGEFVFKDNVFNNSALSIIEFDPIVNDYNAYINTSGTFPGSGGHDVVLTNFTFASGPLGDFYQVS